MDNKKYYPYKNGEIINEKRWVLETDGTNLLDVINQPYIDYKKHYLMILMKYIVY